MSPVAVRRNSPGSRLLLDCHVATLLAMTEIPLPAAMASAVIARHEAIQYRTRTRIASGYAFAMSERWRDSSQSNPGQSAGL
jgi:hypothetical protein